MVICDFGDRGAAHFDRSALRRSLELAAKRCYGNRAHFLQNGFRFGYPQIDWAGNAPGYVGTEFPILPFIAAVCYKLAGVHEWIGRIQAVILFAVSVPFFFLLVREIFASTAVVWATFFYSFAPLNIFAGRSFMPDVPSLSFAIVGLYFFLRWVEHRKSLPLFFAAVAIAVSLLIRITNIIMLVPLAYLVVAGGGDPGSDEALIARAGRRQRRRLQLALFCGDYSAAACDLVLARASNCTGILSPSFLRRRRDSNRIFLVVLADCATKFGIQSHAGSFSAGTRRFVCAAITGSKMLSRFSLVAGCDNCFHHDSRLWQPPPLVSTSIGTDRRRICRRRLRALSDSKIPSRVIAATLSILLVSSFVILAFWYVRPFYQSSAAQLRDAGLELKKVTPPGALIVAADMGDPTIFYYAKCKGWHFLENDAVYNGNPDDSEQAIENLGQLRRARSNPFCLHQKYFLVAAFVCRVCRTPEDECDADRSDP